ncbi:hypothetical protein, partial [Aneurinibacillus tyrosinisolvens]|uniref:hypothetical protein n=1 Tax=Aneurinibacillus tyrosinisolvens TaxID=1443435 RepID=UPI00063F2497
STQTGLPDPAEPAGEQNKPTSVSRPELPRCLVDAARREVERTVLPSSRKGKASGMNFLFSVYL